MVRLDYNINNYGSYGTTTYRYKIFTSRVADPHSFNPDPDPAFRLNTDPDPIRIRIQGFNDQKLKKITAKKI